MRLAAFGLVATLSVEAPISGAELGVIEARPATTCRWMGLEEIPVVPRIRLEAGALTVVSNQDIGPVGRSRTFRRDGAWSDDDALIAHLEQIAQHPSANGTIDVEVESDVPFDQVVAVLDAVRPEFPDVVLFGGRSDDPIW